MSYSPIFELLDYILPNSDRSKNDALRLEHLCSCKIMENENDIINIISLIPSSVFEKVLQSAIYKYYLEYVNIDDDYIDDFHGHFNEREIEFPDTLWILILNWPQTELVLRNIIPALHPPVDIFQNSPMAKRNPFIRELDDMLSVFDIFCRRLLQFIIKAVLKCTPRNTLGFSCNLKKLDLSGLGTLYDSGNKNFCYSLDNILEGIHNSTINTFGHKIEVIVDVELLKGPNEWVKLLKNISEANLDLDFGLSVYLNNISAVLHKPDSPLSNNLFNVLAVQRCKYIQLFGVSIDISFGENICSLLPELVGINLQYPKSIESLEFLSTFAYVEQFSLTCTRHRYNGFVNSISNISKGLKYLDISDCFLIGKNLECLAKSKHSDTLQELNLSSNNLANDSESVGLIKLCQKLSNVKVLIVNECSLEFISLHLVSILVKAIQDCVKLEVLSMSQNVFNVEQTHIITEGLAHKISLRYLSLDLPSDHYHLCKAFHEKINESRNSPIYISSFR